MQSEVENLLFDDRLKNILPEEEILLLQMSEAWRRGDDEEEAWLALEVAQLNG